MRPYGRARTSPRFCARSRKHRTSSVSPPRTVWGQPANAFGVDRELDFQQFASPLGSRPTASQVVDDNSLKSKEPPSQTGDITRGCALPLDSPMFLIS